jgi:ABC-2 type transport system ATP-binding protein
MNRGKRMIEVRDLTKKYGPVSAVKGVSFRVDPGEVVGLLGPNGAGKTSILRVLSGFHHASGGTAVLAGCDIEADPRAVKAAIGYLPENAPLYGEFTVGEYLAFMAAGRGLRRTAARSAIDRAVQSCGLAEVRARRIARLSRGFRQRTCLAQAILHDPPILILDEPSSGLDPNQIIEIRRLIAGLGRSKTVILSTHILSEVQAICRRVLILNDGLLVAEGSPEKIGRSLESGERYTVMLKNAAELAPAGFRDIPGLEKVESFDRDGSRVLAVLRMAGATPDGEVIFAWAVKNGYPLGLLRRESMNLEDIFARLTREAD